MNADKDGKRGTFDRKQESQSLFSFPPPHPPPFLILPSRAAFLTPDGNQNTAPSHSSPARHPPDLGGCPYHAPSRFTPPRLRRPPGRRARVARAGARAARPDAAPSPKASLDTRGEGGASHIPRSPRRHRSAIFRCKVRCFWSGTSHKSGYLPKERTVVRVIDRKKRPASCARD